VSTPAVDIVQVRRLRTISDLRSRLTELGIGDQLRVDDTVEPNGPLSSPFVFTDGSAGAREVANRFAVLPMEGWDGSTEGEPTDLVRRRWRRFGTSGAKLIWGGEAVAVRRDARANPRQLVIDHETVGGLAGLRSELIRAHVGACGSTDGLVVGLQLTHSGRWSQPGGESQPRVAYHHPVLDRRVATAATVVLADDELDMLVKTYADAASLAAEAGFDFVDIKHCHGYLLHELLSAVDRPGPFGGSFQHRTAFLCRVVEQIRRRGASPALGVRLSAFDFVPFESGPDGVGTPSCDAQGEASRFAFGSDATGIGVELAEAHRFLELCRELGIGLVCITAGSPYYNPHIQRPAFFPPSDGYAPPEDPLVGVARMVEATRELATAHPDMAIVGSGYSYLQQWTANAAQHTIRTGGAASVGLGRCMLSYPHLPADVLAGRPLDARLLCRTFSDCTTAPRNGLVSGCYPLDDFYKNSPRRNQLAAIKKATRKATRR
jgi:2,4-dienoyl-CoA reductase-like NADH-dependent reductase (Old Yellow Enzyme family)